jgi:release factor glutamine methyltransferase
VTGAEAAARLAQAGIPDPPREARKLARAAEEHGADLAALVGRRVAGEPMSHILGYRDFWEHRFEVTADVLDPRPETETLVAAALEAPFSRVLDLGTGSGCILLSLLAARDGAAGLGTDLSEAALAVAGRNAERLGVRDRAALIPSDWWRAVTGRFDLIVSNPPYIAADEMAALQPELSHEPRMALTDEGDGLSAYRVLTGGAPAHLAPGGRLMVEIGPTQGAAVAAMFQAAGLTAVEIRLDLDGRDRVVIGTMARSKG